MSEAASEASPASSLTSAERLTVARARQLAALPADASCEYAGETDPDYARAVVLAEAQHLLAKLAAIAERLAAAQVTEARDG